MDYESFARRTFHVGRQRPNAPAVRAFDLRRQPDGARVYLNVEPGMFPTDDERAALGMHFETARLVRVAGSSGRADSTRTELRRPGTPEHFVDAMLSLPPPFILLGSHD